MQILLCIVSVIFGGLSLIAAVSQIKSEKKPPSAFIMLIGSLMLIAAVIFNILGQEFDYMIALLGCVAVCAAAIMNGIKGGQLHIPHHVIRITLSIVLIAGFVLL